MKESQTDEITERRWRCSVDEVIEEDWVGGEDDEGDTDEVEKTDTEQLGERHKGRRGKKNNNRIRAGI